MNELARRVIEADQCAPETDGGGIDREMLSDLLIEYGVDLLREVAASFEAETWPAIDALAEAAAGGDAAASERHAHFIKGSALYLGMTGLSGLCQALEARARRGVCPTEADLALLRSSCRQSISHVGSFVGAP